MKVWISSLLAAAVSLAAAAAVAADNYPTKPVTLLVSHPAGGSVDVTARILQGPLARELGQPVVVDNRAGAGGSIATAQVARAPADGYGCCSRSRHTINPAIYGKLPFDTEKDFAPVSLVASTPQVLVAHPSFPPSSLAELASHARQQGRHLLRFGGHGFAGPHGR